ncbi:DUF1127 domain-containing protein [Ruegeria lacuscaerulensis]|uniref:DUF1127 domain-containing protein n=1 Tax=Ruegeria lacuscaerulensis TaxID=55218 RepID=UPI001479EAA2|nr:DUF1127 domain-containing protein [Ruegeria lacuscaerulensis]
MTPVRENHSPLLDDLAVGIAHIIVALGRLSDALFGAKDRVREVDVLRRMTDAELNGFKMRREDIHRVAF